MKQTALKIALCIALKVLETVCFNLYINLYHNQINARALIGQSAMVYFAGKPMEISRVF